MKRYHAQESSDGKGHLFDLVLQKYTSDVFENLAAAHEFAHALNLETANNVDKSENPNDVGGLDIPTADKFDPTRVNKAVPSKNAFVAIETTHLQPENNNNIIEI